MRWGLLIAFEKRFYRRSGENLFLLILGWVIDAILLVRQLYNRRSWVATTWTTKKSGRKYNL
ncbi:hypothetical protein PROFUN_00747 [Planoprotostelium fungivorum]|uniref:Uncharacterized protein n=1 Tax=Planoprotostelium fungivorum TaxID=1890364 RepID=A0A2P6MTL8_9EUKA|nr:hypothetical protein PROFUN_07417 [Planoprotostelium fungivorum]PRP87536.1 hypothetical protein PROFUN_00747 [Planoprotostelium fungivorum]